MQEFESEKEKAISSQSNQQERFVEDMQRLRETSQASLKELTTGNKELTEKKNRLLQVK